MKMSIAAPPVPSPNSLPNPLLHLHNSANAETLPYGSTEIVSTFGEPQAEYSALHKSAGLFDMPFRAVLELTGKDRLPFLNNLLTNQAFDKNAKTPMASGSMVYAFLLSAKNGRIIADMNVLELGDRTLLELDGRVVETVKEALEKYLFAEKVSIRSLVGEVHEISIHGPGSAVVLETLLDAGTIPAPSGCGTARIIGHDAVVWRDDPCGSPGFMLIIPSAAAVAIWNHLIATFASPNVTGAAINVGKRLLRPIGWAAFNSTRIEAGRPLFGIDFDETFLAAETGQLNRAVSFTKGCYPGQEIVARMHARKQLAKQIAGIRMEGDALPIAGTHIYDEASNQIGGITSSTLAPILSNAAICLGILKKPFFNIGAALQIPAEGAMRKATVVELPFKR
jgi:folate-binding protein YgfZ